MKKFIYLLIASALFVSSCEEDVVIYDTANGQAIAQIINGAEQTLPVPDTGDTAIIEVGVTTVSDVDRTISVSVDPSSTADPSEYDIDQASLVIPAGSFVGEIRVNANFNAIPETGLTSLVLNLDNVQGADNLEGVLSHKINFFRFCPFTNGANFLGEYQLETQVLGIFNTPTLTDGVVNITQGATVADRQFTVAAYPAFGAFTPFTFSFSLICGEVVVSAVDNINVGCGGANAVGPSSVNVSTYNSGDDSELIINFVDDTRDQCGWGAPEVQIKLTKL
ncbi:hypothetical protein OZ410_06645 [Robiginitalea sp. M366]|uniref:hypothetical protein n=1 Tax=Robiginitalea aestuariiviva TaxID=3036903 RepID=UPI00240DE8CD|nr:hypothetical protein [Robiginitalea aestuariiviva]MDG1571988.1 hypothetical protein [Robiginitalea aestuariiviva]